MSTLTKIWTEEKIRNIIRHLEEKTGLNGASLPIAFNNYGRILGHYHRAAPKAFGFNRGFFDNPATKEAEVLDVIRHEYAHFYVDAARIAKYVGHSFRETSHGDDWKWACKMVGADPTRCHNASSFKDKNWSVAEATAAYNADDVVKLDILTYLNRWNRTPLDSDTASRILARIKERRSASYYEIGDEVLHPTKGFGIVQDTIAFDYSSQMIYVCFEDETCEVFSTSEVCKVVHGVTLAYGKKRGENR